MLVTFFTVICISIMTSMCCYVLNPLSDEQYLYLLQYRPFVVWLCLRFTVILQRRSPYTSFCVLCFTFKTRKIKPLTDHPHIYNQTSLPGSERNGLLWSCLHFPFGHNVPAACCDGNLVDLALFLQFSATRSHQYLVG